MVLNLVVYTRKMRIILICVAIFCKLGHEGKRIYVFRMNFLGFSTWQ